MLPLQDQLYLHLYCYLVLVPGMLLSYLPSDNVDDPSFQDASTARDNEFLNNINGLLDDPEYTLQWDTQPSTSQASSSCVLRQSSRNYFLLLNLPARPKRVLADSKQHRSNSQHFRTSCKAELQRNPQLQVRHFMYFDCHH